MAPRNSVKPKRQKKRKSRTEVSSDISSDEREASSLQTPPPAEKTVNKIKTSRTALSSSQNPSSNQVPEPESSSSAPASPEPPTKTKGKSDTEIQKVFTQFYLTQATKEFADDLDRLRTADDFRAEHLPVLVKALGQGVELFGKGEMRRIVEAGDV